METATEPTPAPATNGEAPAPAAPTPAKSPFSTRSPADGKLLPAVDATSPADVAAAVARARAAQRAWADTPVRERALAIARVKKRVLARAEEIAELVHRECGKPIEEAALAEVLPNADLVDYWTAAIEELVEGTTVELDPLAYPGKLGRIHKEARGTIALITPWNYPVAIPLRTLVPALLAGNAVVFKPSEITPRSGALVASLFAGILPAGVLELVQGGGDVGEALVGADVDLVVFTGSVATGRRIAVACAERLVPCSLELGGKDAAIVLADCNVERTARGLVWGAFTNAGQNCASIERAYVEKGVADKLVAKIVEITKELRAGTDTAVITTERQCAIVRRHLEEAVAAGAEILAGGAPEAGSLAFPPTVVKITDEDTPLMREETFGPILPIVVVDSADDAIARTNASRFGLTTSLWTKRVNHAHTLAKRLRSGVVTINNHGFTAALPAAPWTGAGDSGYGITNSPHALAELTRVRFVLEDASRAKSELWWYPYTPVLRTIAFAMARARGGAGFFGRIAAIFQLALALPKRLLGGSRRPLVLLSNDDGVTAPNLLALRDALAALADVVICAPELNQSATSHALSLHRILRLRPVEPCVFALDGTPADCVYVALHSGARILPRRPDLVVSGMNHGLNLGIDVFYSGTVAAAREAAIRGIPAVALSADVDADRPAAAALGAALAIAALDAFRRAGAALPAPLLNVNIPPGRAWPVRATKLGARLYTEEVEYRTDPRGREYLWLGGAGVRHDLVAGSDTEAYDAGIVSITPLTLDLTYAPHAGFAAEVAAAAPGTSAA